MAAFVLLYFGWLGWSTLWSAAANARLVSVFETDEFDHIVALRTALAHHTLAIDWSIYGHFFFNLALVPLLLLSRIHHVSDQEIIVTLRLVALGAAAGATALTFLLGSRYWGRAAGWVAAVGLAVIPSSFNLWAVTSHPDSLQLACTVFSLYAACCFVETRQERWLDAAALGAGLAFASKYGGLLLMPCLVVFAALVTPEPQALEEGGRQAAARLRMAVLLTGAVALMASVAMPPSRRVPFGAREVQQAAALVLTALAAIGPLWRWLKGAASGSVLVPRTVRAASVFWIAFIIASPYSLNRLGFLSGMLAESHVIGFGQFFSAGGSRLDWFRILASPQCLGLGVFLLLLAGFGRYLVALWRERRQALVSADGVLWLWTIGVLLFLIARVHLREPRYLLLILPPAFILAGDAVVRILRHLTAVSPSKRWAGVWIGLALIAAAAQLQAAAARQQSLIRERAVQVQQSAAVQAGVWLQAHVPCGARVLYDWYSYVPPCFATVQGSWGMSRGEVARFNPDVLVVNEAIRGRFARQTMAARFYDPSAFMATYDFYNALEAGRLDFTLMKAVGPVQLFRRRAGSPGLP